MRIRFLTLSFLFTVFALFAGMPNTQAVPEKAKHANSNILSADKSFDNQAKDSVVIAPKSETSEASGTLEPNRKGLFLPGCPFPDGINSGPYGKSPGGNRNSLPFQQDHEL